MEVDAAARPDLARFLAVLEARAQGGAKATDAGFADQVKWTGSTKGVVEGKDAVEGAWSGSAPTPSSEVVGIYVDAEHAVGVTELSQDGNQVHQATVFHLDGDGNITELWTMPTDEQAAAALRGETVPEHPNNTRFRKAEEARARNEFTDEDLALISEFLREDVEWHSPWGQGPQNREQVIAQFQAFNASSGGSFGFVLGETFADDAHAVSIVTIVADRPDRPDAHLEVGEANVFHLDENGHCYEFWGVSADQAAMDAFWM
jgi:hypothetical protein